MNTEPHFAHTWAIAAESGKDGPDLFQCPGRNPGTFVPAIPTSGYESPFQMVGHDGPCPGRPYSWDDATRDLANNTALTIHEAQRVMFDLKRISAGDPDDLVELWERIENADGTILRIQWIIDLLENCLNWRDDETSTRPNASDGGSAKKVAPASPDDKTWTQYGVFDSDGDLDYVVNSEDELRQYAPRPEFGDTVKVRTVTKTHTEWQDRP